MDPQPDDAAAPRPAPNPQPNNSTTAVIAAILALVGGAVSGLHGLGSVAALIFAADEDELSKAGSAFFTITGIVELSIAVGLLAGGAMMLRRRPSAPLVVAIAAGAAILVGIIGIIVIGTMVAGELSGYGAAFSSVPMFASLLRLAFPIATLVLAVLPSTRRYCNG